jgi:mono/diheme cytochrome c family protein
MKLAPASFCRRLPARLGAVALASMACSAPAVEPPTVIDGFRVDAKTFAGYRVWRSQNCGGCHGAEQQGLSGPALVDSLKRLTKEEFVRTVTEGRPTRRMPAFGHVPQVMEQIDGLYVYLKGRADGVITQGQVEPIK